MKDSQDSTTCDLFGAPGPTVPASGTDVDDDLGPPDAGFEREALAAPSEQAALFDLDAPWRAEWRSMPEYICEDLMPYRSITVHFASEADAQAFARLVEQSMTPLTKSLWYPEAEKPRFSDKRYTVPE